MTTGKTEEAEEDPEMLLDGLRLWHTGKSEMELTQNTRGQDRGEKWMDRQFGRTCDNNECDERWFKKWD